MLRFMPMSFYSKVSEKASMGVVAADQVIGDFPEYASTKDTPKCNGICTGGCGRTCTTTGRKYDSLVGYSKDRAVVKESNLLCTPGDPYNGKLNVLMHEFAHAIHLVALGTDFRWHRLLDESYLTWGERWGTGYATSDQKEFFAEATTSYFRTSTLGPEAAEMNLCGDPRNNTICPDEFSSRENLKTKDPTLFRLVDHLYSGGRTFLQGRIGICDW
ncbi:uncharacterized protein LOC135479562 [Liolophura sinensis]|uniref:uncharacterized protein LOC135479562 n=1 Tax=Liolophura sinensis TaxID=3198878 RepID=UPI0031585802